MEIEKSMSLIEINDLFDYGYSICQNSDYFKFSIDSVLLAEFVELKKGKSKVLDLCSGNAPIPLILHKKYGKIDITAIELQKEIYALAIKSLEINKIDSIKVLNDDVQNVKSILKNEKFDIVTCNPPYFKVNNSYINENPIKAIARHELRLSLDSLIENVSKIIQNQGYFYMVHHTTRLAEVIDTLHKYNFGIKRLVFIHDDKERPASLFLIESMFNGKDFVKVLAPVILKENLTYKNIFKR